LADGNAVTARVVISAKSVAKPGAVVAVEVDEISRTNQ
jgi:hypothetical protein